MVRRQHRASSLPCGRKCWGVVGQDAPTTPTVFLSLFSCGKSHGQESCMTSLPRGGSVAVPALDPCSLLPFVLSASCPCLSALSWRVLSLTSLCVDPVSRKNVKSAHSTRNRYSSQWTLTKCQASTPARTLTSDWRTVGSQHGVTVTESDSYSASLSQDTGVSRDLPVFRPSSSSSPRSLPTSLFASSFLTSLLSNIHSTFLPS